MKHFLALLSNADSAAAESQPHFSSIFIHSLLLLINSLLGRCDGSPGLHHLEDYSDHVKFRSVPIPPFRESHHITLTAFVGKSNSVFFLGA